jgi:hypothetical protein
MSNIYGRVLREGEALMRKKWFAVLSGCWSVVALGCRRRRVGGGIAGESGSMQ